MTSLFQATGAAISGRLAATDLNMDAGRMVAIVGPNGGGKTSLLRACAGIDGTAVSIAIDGESLRTTAPARRGHLLGYLPASRELVWPIAVRDLIALALPSPDPPRVDELIALLELAPLADRAADRLSTGERARVLLARVLAPKPRVLLLDEPLSNLDPYWVLRTLDLLRAIAGKGAAVAVALHDIERIGSFDRVLLVNDGAVRADLTPPAMLTDREFARAFRIERGDSGWQLSSSAGPRS